MDSDLDEGVLSVSRFVAVCNDVFLYQFADLQVVGEVASYKVNQGKWVFFDLKDEKTSISCFMPVWDLRTELEDGMKVVVCGIPKLTQWGKFSFTVKRVMPVGEGNIKKSFEKLKKKLAAEGLFAAEKKRPIPREIKHLAVISSTQAAGYADFIKILNARWGGIKISVAHTQVQGLEAPDQIMRALKYFNEKGEADVIAILRGGGSKDDLAVFNDEALTRAVAASRIPVVTGIGHEIDESLCDLAADLRASTPSNAAELLVPDRKAEIAALREKVGRLHATVTQAIEAAMIDERRIAGVHSVIMQAIEGVTFDTQKLAGLKTYILDRIAVESGRISEARGRITREVVVKITTLLEKVQSKQQILAVLNPDKVLSQGYAILSGKISPGEELEITTINKIIMTEIRNVRER